MSFEVGKNGAWVTKKRSYTKRGWHLRVTKKNTKTGEVFTNYQKLDSKVETKRCESCGVWFPKISDQCTNCHTNVNIRDL